MSGGQAAATTTPAADKRSEPIPSISQATTVSELKASLASLNARHVAVSHELDGAIQSHGEVTRQLSKLDLTRARLGTLSNSTRALSHGQLSGAAATAKRLSEAVSRLDLEQERVKGTLAVVEQVAELKSCVLGVVGSMGAPQDWETAAEYMNRASRIPRDVIESEFAQMNVPTAEVPEPPAQTLDEAGESLCRLFQREFEKAVEENNGANITRFFKVFPLIDRTQEGLEAYGRYVCQGVAVRARDRLQGVSSSANGTACVNAFTKLFEHIAQVVDGHSNLVQRHYGPGTMVKVMERLHLEADIQGGIVLDTWHDERSIHRKLTDVKSYAYNFLVQSFLHAPKGGTGTPRRSPSPAPGRKHADAPEPTSDDTIDVREIDQVLSEITSMLSPWSLYLRFCASRALETSLDDTADEMTLPPLSIPSFIANSNLPAKIDRILLDPFKNFATFILRRSVERAFQVEDKPTGLSLNLSKPLPANTPYITTSVDDVMYMVRQVLSRALATSQASLVAAVGSSIGRVLGSDFIGMIQRKMRDESYPKAAIQGTMPPEEKILTFLVLMNNLDVATNYIRQIVREHVPHEPEDTNGTTNGAPNPRQRHLSDLFPLDHEASKVHSSLTALESGFVAKATDLIEDGMAVLYTHVMGPRLRPWLNELLNQSRYVGSSSSSEPDSDTDDADDRSVQVQAQRGWEARIRPLRRLLTNANAGRLMTVVIGNVSNLVEKRVWSYTGHVSEVGGMRLERDVGELAAVIAGEDLRLRQSFARCAEIVSVMNMDDEEWELLRNEGPDGEAPEMTWALSDKERRRARGIVAHGLDDG
ncbi:MAG: hypothetical protein Q9159_005826 [Coniocarpon cinnabarinum]